MVINVLFRKGEWKPDCGYNVEAFLCTKSLFTHFNKRILFWLTITYIGTSILHVCTQFKKTAYIVKKFK